MEPRRSRVAPLCFALAMVLAGCLQAPAPPPPDPPVDPQSQEPAPPSQDPAPVQPTARPAPRPVAEPWPLVLEQVAMSLRQPVSLANAGDGSGRLFVVEREGYVRFLRDGADKPEPYLDVSAKVACCEGEMGLHGLAFHPDFEENGRLFITYSREDRASVLEEWTVRDPPDGRPAESREVLVIPQPFRFHYAGWIGFGPDGFLYYMRGDGHVSNASVPGSGAQDLRSLLGKVLRLDVDVARPYGIPPGNPFAQAGGRPEIWALGLRNPWRASIDPATGDLWIGDVGLYTWEEIDRVPAGVGGLNFGWRDWEAEEAQREGARRDGMTSPFHAYEHGRGGDCAVMGGHVVHGPGAPGLAGWYVFGDFCSGRVRALAAPTAADEAPGSARVVELLDTEFLIASFGEDEAGDVYVIDLKKGGLHRLATPAP